MDVLDNILPAGKILRYVLVAGLVGAAALYIHQLNHPLRKYPAANRFVTLPYIGETWFAWLTLKGNPDKTLQALHRKLGKVVRIGPNEVSIDDSDAVKDLYGHGNDIEKGMFPDGLWDAPLMSSKSLLGFRCFQMDHVLFDE
jgi:hypothetical protein